MIVRTSKICDGCRATVAIRSILFHTVKDYVTIKKNEVPTYVNYEDSTTTVDLHYCRDCWNTITENLPFKRKVVMPYDV